jgi:scyllo-inositol 2-dehydrogenase (NADP+)
MAGKIIRVGIAGQGRSGFDIHARWLRTVPQQFQITAVADLLPERRAQAKAELGCRVFKDYTGMLKAGGFDLFVNAMPSYLHPKGVMAALNAGYHTVCEKPSAVKVADFDKMVAASRKNRRVLAPFQNSRFQPAFAKIREVLASGVLGDLVHARLNYSGFARRWDWQTKQEFWGGNINNTGPHPLDMAVVLFGERRPEVFAKLWSGPGSFGDADDFSMVVLHGKNTPTVEVFVSSYSAYPIGDIFTINGTRGGLSGNFQALKWRSYDPAKAPKQALMKGWSDNRAYNSEQLPWVEADWKLDIPDVFQKISQGFYDNVYGALVNGGKLEVSLNQVRRQVYALEEAHRQNPLPRLSAKKAALKKRA